MSEGTNCFEEETLTPANKANEMIMTGLRTKWGVNLDLVKQKTGIDLPTDKIEALIAEGLLRKDRAILTVTRKGKLFADQVASHLFVD